MKNTCLKWDYMKSEIWHGTISYSKTQARLRHDYEEQLKKEYNDLVNGFAKTHYPQILNEIENIKTQIAYINKEKTAGSQIGANALALKDDKDAGYFVNVEKKNDKVC